MNQKKKAQGKQVKSDFLGMCLLSSSEKPVMFVYSLTKWYSKTTGNVSVMWKQMKNVNAVLYSRIFH